MQHCGIIWDLDGTLADTIADIAGAANAALVEGGFAPLAAPAFPALVGNGSRRLIEDATGSTDAAAIDRMHAHFMEHYNAHAMDHTQPFAGVIDVLQTLHARGVPMCVLSNKPHAFTVAMVNALFPPSLFRVVQGQRQDWPLKPDPTVALEQCRTMKRSPERVLFVGDTEIDIETAKRGGLRPIGVRWGFRPVDELIAAGAETILDAPAALLDVLVD